jgi:hypothetical protein
MKFILVTCFFIYSFTLCLASHPVKEKDTACNMLTLKSNRLIYCKIKRVTNTTVEYAPCGNTNGPLVQISLDSVMVINFPNGRYILMRRIKNSFVHIDSNGVKDPRIFASIGPGVSMPVGNYSYPQDTYTNGSQLENQAGYATAGIACHADFEVAVGKGFGFTALASYFHNGFGAESYLQDNSRNYVLEPIYESYTNSGNKPTGSTVTSTLTGNSSHYNSYAFFVGIKKDFDYRSTSSFSLGLSLGRMVTGTAAFNGNINMIITDTLQKQTVVNDAWHVSAGSISNLAVNMAAEVRVKIAPNFYFNLTTNITLMISNIYRPLTFQSTITDASGNVIASPQIGIASGVTAMNFILGVGYYF